MVQLRMLALLGVAHAARMEMQADEQVEGVAGPIKFTQVGGTTGVGGNIDFCLDVSGAIVEGAHVKASRCHGGSDQHWMYNQNGEQRLQVGGKFLCLEQKKGAGEAVDQLFLAKCIPNKKSQKWSWSNHAKDARRVKNAATGQCLGLRYATDFAGGKAVTGWSCGKSPGQALQLCNEKSKPGCAKFAPSLIESMEVENVEGVAGPIRFTKVGGSTGVGGTQIFCLDVSGAIESGAKVKAGRCHGGTDQHWMYNENGEGRIQVGHKFLCLEQAQGVGEAVDQLSLQHCVPNKKSQKWTWQDHKGKGGKARMVKNAASGQCLGLRYATDFKGGKAVTGWKCGKAPGQAVQLCNDKSKAGCSSSLIQGSGVQTAQGVAGPIKFTKVGGTTGIGGTEQFCLDVIGSIEVNAQVKASRCHGGSDQHWSYNENGEGRIQIGSKHLCLEQKQKAGEAVDQLFLANCIPNKKTQNWLFSDHPDKKGKTARRMKNAKSGQCIGLRYATDFKGGKAVTGWSCGKSPGQGLQLCNDPKKPGC